MKITEYRNTDGFRKWELYYEGVRLVLLNNKAPLPYRSELLGFADLQLVWRLSPQMARDNDAIVGVMVKEAQLYAFSFSGFRHRINHETGEIIETSFTK